jgi:hypothetical protein
MGVSHAKCEKRAKFSVCAFFALANSTMIRYNAAWLHGCMAAWLHGCMAAWLHGCMAAWLHLTYSSRGSFLFL